MLENIATISPLFVIMMAGFAMGRTQIFPEGSGAARTLNTFVWYVAIPALIFKLLAGNKFPSITEIQILVAYYGVLYSLYFTSAFIIAPRLGIAPKGRGIFAFSCSFGNMGFIGIPLIEGTLGTDGLRILLMLISFHMLTLLPITTLITELAKQDAGSPGQILMKAIIDSIKNPVVLSLFAGLFWSGAGLTLSPAMTQILALPAGAAAPVGLFALGLSLTRVKLRGDLMQAIVPVLLKMLAFPLAVYWVMTELMDVSELWVSTTTLAACMPAGMAAYTIAEHNQCGARRSASSVLLGTLFSAFTLVIAVSLLT